MFKRQGPYETTTATGELRKQWAQQQFCRCFSLSFFDVPEQLQCEMTKLISSSLENARQGNTGDKGPVIIYHRRKRGRGVGGFGAKHGETWPIPPWNVIIPNWSPLITLDNFCDPPPPPPRPTFPHPYLPFDSYIYCLKVHKSIYHRFLTRGYKLKVHGINLGFLGNYPPTPPLSQH